MADPRYFELDPGRTPEGREKMIKVKYTWSYEKHQWFTVSEHWEQGEREIRFFPLDEPGRLFILGVYKLNDLAENYPIARLMLFSPCDLESEYFTAHGKLNRRPPYIPGGNRDDIVFDDILSY